MLALSLVYRHVAHHHPSAFALLSPHIFYILRECRLYMKFFFAACIFLQCALSCCFTVFNCTCSHRIRILGDDFNLRMLKFLCNVYIESEPIFTLHKLDHFIGSKPTTLQLSSRQQQVTQKFPFIK